MLDPFFQWCSTTFKKLIALIVGLVMLVLAPFIAIYTFIKSAGLFLKILVLAMLLPLLFAYGNFVWHTLWIRGFDTQYTQKLNLTGDLVRAGEQVSSEGGGEDTKTCGNSRIVDVTAHLLDFNINQNKWISSMPQYKFGVFEVIDWDQTWIFDNKAAFQRGVHQSISRTAVELTDALGRVRGTSQINPDLKIAKGNIQFDQYTWYFNPFGSQPFGPTTPTPTYFRAALKSLDDYNKNLANCKATFDARADNPDAVPRSYCQRYWVDFCFHKRAGRAV